MAGPALSQTQRGVLHALTSLIQGLATAPDGAIDRTDQFLKGISDLPVIKDLLGEAGNDDVSGSEFYTYFSGVALLLRSLLEKVENDEVGLAFLNDVKKVHDDLAPERKRNVSETEMSSISEKKRKLSADAYDDEVTFISARALTPDPTSTSNINESLGMHLGYPHLSSPTRATRPPNWHPAQQTTVWQDIQVKSLYRPLVSTQKLPHPVHIRSTVIALHAVFGPSGIKHLRNLQWDLSYPTSTPLTGVMTWQSMLTPQKPENIYNLWQCCLYFRDRVQKRATLGLDAYAHNLARMEFRRLWIDDEVSAMSLGSGPFIIREVNKELDEGAKIRLLAKMFGKGVLVLIGQDALENIDRQLLKHVVATIATWNGGVLHARIQDVCRRAEYMMNAAVHGVDGRFHSATQDIIENLERITG